MTDQKIAIIRIRGEANMKRTIKDTFKMLQIMVHNTLRHFTRAKTGSVWQKGNFFIEIKLKYR